VREKVKTLDQVERKKTPLMDMVAQYHSIQGEIDDAIRQVLEAGQFILGPNVASLEKEVAAYLGVGHGVGVASGTDALILALRALDIGPGDEVIMPTYTFFATAGAVMLVGATPVLVDVEPDTYCINVAQIAACITPKTKAIIPVHLYGHPADMTQISKLAKEQNLKVIEDNAQAFGAQHRERKTSSIGDVGCLSFFPSKNLGAYGDGGMVVTNNTHVSERLRMLRTHGWKKKYFPEVIGYNSRLDELQAAILRVKLRHIDDWTERRRDLALQYSQLLEDVKVGRPVEGADARHVYHLYIVRVKDRERVQQELKEQGIPTAIYYPQPLHLAEPLRHLGHHEGDFPIAEQASRETLALPFFPEMTDEQLHGTVDVLKEVVGR
jgi:dTDP-4-amino-4,6-dideoxygalactose transaminase